LRCEVRVYFIGSGCRAACSGGTVAADCSVAKLLRRCKRHWFSQRENRHHTDALFQTLL
jgi:hypothetical protein